MYVFVSICRGGKALPDGLTVNGARLLFGRALRQNDSGVYDCGVNNGFGTRKVESNITVTGNGQSYSCILGEPGQHNRTYLPLCLVPFVQHCCPLVMIWNTNFAQIENLQLISITAVGCLFTIVYVPIPPIEKIRSVQETTVDTLVMIIIVVAAGVLVIVMIIIIILVNRYHRRKNRKLEMELSERTWVDFHNTLLPLYILVI